MEASSPVASGRTVPRGACDCHIHIYDPAAPMLVPGAFPGPPWATTEGYKVVQRRLGLERAVVVQPNAYGRDNRVTLEAIAQLGLATTRGVATIGSNVSDAELARLHDGGIRGARFHMLPGGALSWEDLEPVAQRIAPLGWHVLLQMDGGLLPDRESQIGRLPVDVVIDHGGRFPFPTTHDYPGFQTLLRLLENGRTWLKLAGPYETSRAGPPLYEDFSYLARIAAAYVPQRMIWASNWPHVALSEKPDEAKLLDLLSHWVPDETLRNQVLVDNPNVLYGFFSVC